MTRIGLIPFFKITTLWVVGVLIYDYFDQIPFGAICLLTAVLILLSSVFAFGKIAIPPSKNWIVSVITGALIISTSISISGLYSPQQIKKHIINQTFDYVLVEAEHNGLRKERSVKVKAKVLSIKHNGAWINSEGTILSYFLDTSTNIKVGQRFIVSATSISQIQPPSNPNQFNYKKYLANKRIYHQAFINKHDFKIEGLNTRFSLKKTFEKTRKKMLANLAFLNDNTRGVAEALLLGYKENLDDDVRAMFSKTGTMHVLAVSGLHVGIIYKAVDWLLFFLIGVRYGKPIKVSILLAVLWSYALLTGMPPSVMRASLMFSFITIGSSLNRPNNIFNNVFASAFILLCIDPKLIYDVGFQLSYSAVLGILVFQPFFASLWYVKNRIGKFIWDLITVSFAAQIAVAPLTIYYFHQLPIVFLVSNLIAIPGAFLVVMIGAFLQIANLINDAMASWVEIIYQFALDLMVGGINGLSQLPFTHISNLKIDQITLFTSIVLIILVAQILIAKSKKSVFASLSLVLALTVYSIVNMRFLESKYQWVLFDTRNTTCLGIKTKNQAYLTYLNDSSNVDFQTSGWFIEHAQVNILGTKDTFQNDLIYKKKSLISIGKEILIYNPTQFIDDVDYYIFSKSGNFKNLEQFEPNKCIFDTSIKPEWVLNKYPNFAEAHFVQRDGAFLKEIR